MAYIVRLYPVRVQEAPTAIPDGSWLVAYDPEGNHGRGIVEVSLHAADACRFASKEEAFKLWRAIPRCQPKRPDGKPNRPLTAFHAEILDETQSDLPPVWGPGSQ